ncbi:mip protein [Chlamydia pneumoniae TW-183]|uniref:Peptidyl-prolyl cis-trans isomerase Mip n=2 Tax=Chlamydia pneumoniae TaxID=83558 RepID=MIP_CHLPN|nr:FKBP-type peptidyl-prolyl cis-trans isomerase [Chlamydia pneumoniae]Q9Z7P3.1 RecName: Full=Peptidyl-prolyl cis-trans isomerase Mip; Short=PPIase; AltName: Full=Rotamase; Flags: Precursor [Chlamydia pneumoniae]AAD18800.1 FKBP-type peptidyl-prolyl cis-trans isomerase [Chlamydia pneumoniae CWL029]AAF37972.1 peptidyl-prolyl cis-trans isomerase Mip [Chlamydia pneumoniae AR39]AAP98616.1 mip protein [Chlamydia pneumoniae TW-183]ACZ32545.1 peptidyl-prolyl cis-trans isomerase Mip [Chlamydia pneumoni
MNRRWNLVLATVALALSVASCDVRSKDKDKDQGSLVEYKDNKDTNDIELSDNQKLSRTFGHLLARQLRKSEDMFFDIAEVAKGLQAELVCKSAPLTETEYEEKMAEVQKLVFEKKSKENLSLAEKFLKENSKNAGVVEVQPSKLQYKIIKEGAGKAISGKPSALLHYKGSFINGQVFSSSEGNNEPILLPLGQTIPGFALGMQGMKEGETRVLYIHPDLAYGTAGQLPPNSLLIFEINLIQASADEVAAVPQEGNQGE